MQQLKQILLYSIASTLIIFQSMSCSKKSSPAPACKVIAVTISSATTNETANITYNDAGKISILEIVSASSTYTKVFTYSGNLIITNGSVGGIAATIETDSIVVNSDGLMVTDVFRTNSDWRKDTYTYSGMELTGSSYQQDPQTPPVATTAYVYTNGDLTLDDGTIIAYNDKPSAAGDDLQIFQLLQYGAPIIKSQHQPISEQISGSNIANFDYTYDTSGKITKMVLTEGADITTYIYTYECN